MAALISAGLGAVSGALGSRSARKQRRKARKSLRRSQQRSDFFAQLERGQLEQALRDLTEGFDVAEQRAGRIGEVGRRRVREGEQVSRGRLQQQLQRTGFGNSTVASNLERGLQSDTSRRLQEIDVGMAGLFSDMAQRRGAALAGGRQALGASFARQGAANERFQDRRFDFQTTSFAPPARDFSGIGAGLAGLFGDGKGIQGLFGN